jgi:hypothetical protein
VSLRDCELYMVWRMAGNAELGVHRCGHNTARLDLKILHLIFGHALKRGFLNVNPCASLLTSAEAGGAANELCSDRRSLERAEHRDTNGCAVAYHDD